VAIDVRHPSAAEAAAGHRGRTRRTISAIGPVTALAGVTWAFVQPYRVTLLDPRGEGFWWLVAQPPLLVIAVGAIFHLLVARSLLADIEDDG